MHLLAGLRLGLVDISAQTRSRGTQFHTEAAKVLPRAGVAYDLVPGVTLFAGYGEGLRAVRSLPAPALPKPEEAASWKPA